MTESWICLHILCLEEKEWEKAIPESEKGYVQAGENIDLKNKIQLKMAGGEALLLNKIWEKSSDLPGNPVKHRAPLCFRFIPNSHTAHLQLSSLHYKLLRKCYNQSQDTFIKMFASFVTCFYFDSTCPECACVHIVHVHTSQCEALTWESPVLNVIFTLNNPLSNSSTQ